MKPNLKTDGTNIYVKVVSVTPAHVTLHLNGEEFLIPYTRVPCFREAKVKDVFDVRMNGLDEIRWDTLDIDLDVDSLKYPEKYPLIMKPYIMEEEQVTAAESEIVYKATREFLPQ